jgi:hypothetical protein
LAEDICCGVHKVSAIAPSASNLAFGIFNEKISIYALRWFIVTECGKKVSAPSVMRSYCHGKANQEV